MKILFLIIFFNSLTFSQINNGFVIYKIIPVLSDDLELEKIFSDLSPNYLELIKDFEFKLVFNKKESFFDISEKYKNDNSIETKFAKSKIKFSNPIFQTKDSIYEDLKNFFLGGKNILYKNPKKWELSNESKKIGNYTCYKATTTDLIVNEVRVFKFPVTAWYCPEINIPFGPLCYGGLPGLILELQTKDGVFGIFKIIINPDQEIAVPKIGNVKIISEEELDNKVKIYINQKSIDARKGN